MTKYRVEFKGVAWAADVVEAENESDAIEAAFANGFPRLCAGCSGYDRSWSLEITEDPSGWDLDEGSITQVED